MDADSDIGFASTQSDEEFSEDEQFKKRIHKKLKKEKKELELSRDQKQNIIIKLRNRETFGFFSNHPKKQCRQQPYRKIPSSLSFCLKNIIPCCFLEGHIFMGLTSCGQFLISYRVRVDDELGASYDFTAVYRYELYFWIYRPHYPLHKYLSVCLFDDHGVDGVKKVSMTQWSANSAVLIVHGASDTNENDSYLTYVRVPKLGCLECKEMRRDYFDGTNAREAVLCIKCALTVHVKYRMDSCSKFSPEVNLNCPNYIIMTETSMIHTINIKLDVQRPRDAGGNSLRFTPFTMSQRPIIDCDARSDTQSSVSENDTINARKMSIVDEIIGDFEELETAEAYSGKITPKLVFLESDGVHTNNVTHIKLDQGQSSNQQKINSEISPSTSRGTKGLDDIIPLKDITSCKISPKEKIKLYDFSEETEKCEKISAFRKRRLADKKYEFIEDTFDNNILPFNRIRDRIRSRIPRTPITQTSSMEIGSHLHRVSPIQGFRSSCGSPVGNRFLRSPPGLRSPNYYQRSPSHPVYSNHNPVKYINIGMMSPKQNTRRTETNIQNFSFWSNGRDDLRRSIISSPVHKPYDIENNENHSSLSNLVESKTDKELRVDESQEPWKLLCSKKFTRRFVEEDDANSIITTTDEDDCISPGYHTALPLEVHGACYSNLQSISSASCGQLKHLHRPIVYITQNTFDAESFTVHVTTFVCKQNNKVYDMLSDSTYSIIHTCPVTSIISCVMRVEFFAIDVYEENLAPQKEKSYSTRKSPGRHKYLLRTLFTWNIEDGTLNVIDYGKMHLLKSAKQTVTTINIQQLTKRIADSQSKIFPHLRILTADMSKSKRKLTDMQNMIEFYRKSKSDVSDFTLSDSSQDYDGSSDADTNSDV